MDVFRSIVVKLLELEARLVLRKYRPKIIAVTGSVGKTTTKDAIYAALAGGTFVRKSDKSFNSEIGLPLAILGLPNAWKNPLRWLKNLADGAALLLLGNEYPEWLVLEVGADRPGDIASIARWLHSDVVVITRFPDAPVHVEYFDSPEAVFAEKKHLVSALKPDGTLILNADDERVLALKREAKHKVITFGFSEGADVKGSHLLLSYREEGRRVPEGITLRADMKGSSIPLSLTGTIGAHIAYAALAALAAGSSVSQNPASLAESLRGLVPPPGRMRVIPGLKDTTIIDDSYNSSPVAALAAVETLRNVETTGRKIAVLGDMLELGRFSADEHKALGAKAAEACDLLLTVGFRARGIAEGALSAGMNERHILQYEDSQKAGKELEGMLEEGDVILVKGSQSMRMERVVEEIMAEPERAGELLARQESEWKGR